MDTSTSDSASNSYSSSNNARAGRLIRYGPKNADAIIGNYGGAGIQLSFLAAAWPLPPGFRPVTSAVLRTTFGAWLFNCGEDSQRHLYRQPFIRHRKIERIFITRRHADNLTGLPGMLCTISAARERGHENADMPVHVYGPPGTSDYVRTMMSVSETYLEMPVLIHEFTPRSVAPEEREPMPILRRAKLWRVLLPPDQLNEDGYYDGDMKAMMGRHTRRQKKSRVDNRANSRELPLPEPGNPNAKGIGLAQLSWTIRCDDDYMVTAIPLLNTTPTWGFIVREADRAGRLNVEACEELGVGGKLRGVLKAGQEVMLHDGTVVRPEQVMSPDSPGRILAVLGTTPDPRSAAAAAAGADVVAMEVAAGKGAPKANATGAASSACTLDTALAFASRVQAAHLLVMPAQHADVAPLQTAAAATSAPAAAVPQTAAVAGQSSEEAGAGDGQSRGGMAAAAVKAGGGTSGEAGNGDSEVMAVSVVQDADILIIDRKAPAS